jgi:hypothetical protein
VSSSLLDRAINHFKKKGYTVELNVMLEDLAGFKFEFDMLVKKVDSAHVVRVFDWRRSVGVNMIINVDRAAEEVAMPNPIVIAKKFSDHAITYARRRGLTLLTEADLQGDSEGTPVSDLPRRAS